MNRLIAVALLTVSFVTSGASGAAAKDAKQHRIDFSVRSSDSDTVCVSWYEATSKQGPAKDPTNIDIDLQDSPWSVRQRTAKKVGHWRITAWAADDCRSTDQPDGTVRCSIEVDGTRRVRDRGTDQIIFCAI